MECTNNELINNQSQAEKTWHQLLKNVGIILNLKKNTESLNQQFDDSFTVFSALGFEEKELKHCQIIYSLLNPEGKHGLGDVFLREFFKTVMDNEEYESATVKSEYDIKSEDNSGRIDLYIKTANACYPIEVKINADDQETQIYRYYKFAKDSNKNKFIVFYLTLNRTKPKPKSTKGMTDEDLNKVKCITFKEKILPWLRICAELAYKNRKISIYGAIHQYITLIEKLTIKQEEKEHQEDTFMNSITEVMALSGEYVGAAKAIADNFKKVQSTKVQDIFDRIKSHVATKLDGEYSTSQIENFYSGDGGYPQLKFKFKTSDSIILTLIFEIADDESEHFYYGVVPEFLQFYSGEKYDDKKHCKLIQERKDDIISIFDNDNWQQYVQCIPKAAMWVWWKFLPSKEEQPDFMECNDNYLKLYNPNDYELFLNKIFAEIDGNLQHILKCGVSKDLSNVESYKK
ncbi:MAG: PD-(D/E)XK nuclease family protein [Ruminobacter sp.]|nr:PD-(D/E)XK nuclease family protein [Ruminobacter sp.]